MVIDSQQHQNYGFACPLTYALYAEINNSAEILVKFSINESWEKLPESNAEKPGSTPEMVRFEYDKNLAFVSVAFNAESDSLFIKIIESGNTLPIKFQQICPYFDNRKTAVTLSADDMAGWSQAKFEIALAITRSYNLWVTCAINTNGAGPSTYAYIQNQLDSGYVEAGCHSRSHPAAAPYDDYEWEITGNRDDIILNLDLPALFKKGDKEFVYSWIAPNGYVDDTIESIVGREKFLVNRLYESGYFGFPDWNEETGYYEPVGVARAFDPPRERLGWGIGSDDIDDLNGAFDQAYETGEVYHVMCHPNVVEWDSSYTWDHLEYISNRDDVWYVSLGQLFLYHYAEQNYTINPTIVEKYQAENPVSFQLAQNYPNPFNSGTTITYSLKNSGEVELSIYDLTGQRIHKLASGRQSAGEHQSYWDAIESASGVYIYRLQVGELSEIKKMILVK